MIAACFSAEDRPLTPVEVHALAVKDYPSLGIATVYRTVNAFVAAGILTPIVVGGATRYELADKIHHHHFYCLKCDRAFCLEDCPVSKMKLAPQGFTVESHQLVVSGACPACAQKNTADRSNK